MIDKQKLKQVEDYDLKFSDKAQIAYDGSPSECIYCKKGETVDDNTELFLFLDNELETTGTRIDMNEIFTNEYFQVYENDVD